MIYCLRELHRAPHSFCFQALQQYPSEIWLSILYMSSILSLSHYTTKYNLCQLLSTGHPLNISLFFNKDWTSLCFVTVTSCDGDADQHIIGGIRRCNISLCNCVGRESHVACCACVSVCCHGKINTGWKANEKLEQVCGVQPQTFTEMWRISSQFHGLLVWHREFIWD